MKRLAFLLAVLLFLSGCSSSDSAIDPAVKLRNQLLEGSGCSFTAEISADYGDEVYEFALDCIFDQQGNMSFTVVKPETIESITGKVEASGGSLTFDESILAFPVLADDLLTPVSSPWFMVNALRSGYLVACGKDRDGYQIKLDDSFTDHMIRVDVWTDQQLKPLSGEIQWDGRRILTIKVIDYKLL